MKGENCMVTQNELSNRIDDNSLFIISMLVL